MPQTLNKCRGYVNCERSAEPGDTVCRSCAEDGFGVIGGIDQECVNCGAPGGHGEHGYCGSCHDAGLCHVCHPDD